MYLCTAVKFQLSTTVVFVVIETPPHLHCWGPYTLKNVITRLILEINWQKFIQHTCRRWSFPVLSPETRHFVAPFVCPQTVQLTEAPSAFSIMYCVIGVPPSSSGGHHSTKAPEIQTWEVSSVSIIAFQMKNPWKCHNPANVGLRSMIQ